MGQSSGLATGVCTAGASFAMTKVEVKKLNYKNVRNKFKEYVYNFKEREHFLKNINANAEKGNK